MGRSDINRSGELEVFIRVVERGGFSAASRTLAMTPSAVSKLILRLERRLGTRLINRSTRQLQLTPEGRMFYERGVRILADLNEAEHYASRSSSPRGRLRVNANVPFGHHFLLPLAHSFLERYPEVSLDIELTDKVIDVLEQRTDVAVRAGPLKNSTLVARSLGATRMVIVGAPKYLDSHGIPETPEELRQHNLIGLNYARALGGWPLHWNGGDHTVLPKGNAQASDGEGVRRLVLAGLGLARLAAFQAREDIAAGRLVPIMEPLNPGDLEEVHVVFMGQGGHLPLRARVFIDFMVEHVRLDT